MSCQDSWNKIVAQVKKNISAKEEIVQNAWEMLFSMVFNYSDSEIDSQRSVKMGVMTKRADIVIKSGAEDLFVVELKRHVLHEGQEQLFSYLNQLKVDLGVLACDKLYIYDYDFTAKEESFSALEIPLEQDNSNGARFVELFSKENFDKEKIRAFIKEGNAQKQAASEIKKEINSSLILELLKKHFTQKYPGVDVEKVLEDFNISVVKKSASSQPSFKSVSNPVNFTNSFQNFSGTKDSSRYSVNGVPSGGKCPATYAAVKQYVDAHSGIAFSELQAAFPDYMAKPGFGKMLRRFEEVGNNEWGGHRFNKHPIILSDGTKVVVSTQWTPHNMRSFIEGAKKLGIDIQPL